MSQSANFTGFAGACSNSLIFCRNANFHCEKSSQSIQARYSRRSYGPMEKLMMYIDADVNKHHIIT